MSPLTSWLAHPWLLGAGLAAVSLPILIHLLSRRRYRLVDWAAMEFLLAAERKNRRRIRLEDLTLLILRCLAVLCLGVLVARPFLPSSMTAGLASATRQEHIILLDESLSMQAQLGTETAFDRARRQLLNLCRQLANEPAEHVVRLYRTSQPQKFMWDDVNLSASTTDVLLRSIEELQPSQQRSQLAQSLEELQAQLEERDTGAHRVVYLFTDLRTTDWDEATIGKLRRLADRVQAVHVLDCAEDDDRNLSLVELRPEGLPIAGLPLPIEVLVKNQGSVLARDIRVELTAGPSLPLTATIDRLAPHETSMVRLHAPVSNTASEPAAERPTLTLKAELKTGAQSVADRLEADNVGFFAASIKPGIRVLLVDGAIRPDESRSQSFYLRRALAPVGPVASGIQISVTSEDQLETVTLDDYEVVFLLNAAVLSERASEVVDRLSAWVDRGGALAILPGDQIDADEFNRHLWREGRGLSPFPLQRIQGDERREHWVQLQFDDESHELTKHFAGSNNPLLASLKVFRWWQAALGQTARDVQVLARLTHPEQSPAIARKSHGKGLVIGFCFPADAEWTNWPAEPSYVLFMQDLVRWLSSGQGTAGSVFVGQPLQAALDITKYETTATLADPAGRTTALQASPPTDKSNGDSTQWELRSPPTTFAGIHQLQLLGRDGSKESRALAVNVDPAEGDLRRLDQMTRQSLASSKIKVSTGDADFSTAMAGSKVELWHLLLIAAFALLFAEQSLGWYLGRVRS